MGIQYCWTGQDETERKPGLAPYADCSNCKRQDEKLLTQTQRVAVVLPRHLPVRTPGTPWHSPCEAALLHCRMSGGRTRCRFEEVLWIGYKCGTPRLLPEVGVVCVGDGSNCYLKVGDLCTDFVQERP